MVIPDYRAAKSRYHADGAIYKNSASFSALILLKNACILGTGVHNG